MIYYVFSRLYNKWLNKQRFLSIYLICILYIFIIYFYFLIFFIFSNIFF